MAPCCCWLLRHIATNRPNIVKRYNAINEFKAKLKKKIDADANRSAARCPPLASKVDISSHVATKNSPKLKTYTLFALPAHI